MIWLGMALGIAYIFIGLCLLMAFDNAYRSTVGPILGDRGSFWVGVGVLLWPVSLAVDIACHIWRQLRGRNRRRGGAR